MEVRKGEGKGGTGQRISGRDNLLHDEAEAGQTPLQLVPLDPRFSTPAVYMYVAPSMIQQLGQSLTTRTDTRTQLSQTDRASAA